MSASGFESCGLIHKGNAFGRWFVHRKYMFVVLVVTVVVVVVVAVVVNLLRCVMSYLDI